MHYLKRKEFGKVQAFEMGWSPVGKPSMTVHFYVVDGICIDTGFRRMQKEAVVSARQSQIDRIVLTHHHEDHSGNAAAMHAAFNIPVLGHTVTVEKKNLRISCNSSKTYTGRSKDFKPRGLILMRLSKKSA